MTHIENLTIPSTECLIQFGHSIEKGPDGKWYLTGLLQMVEELGESPDSFRGFIRTARREFVGPDTSSAIVGGGKITIAATAEVYKRLEAQGEAPKVIVHCGGRAGYLEKAAADDPTISEGKVMQQVFNDRLHSQAKSPQVLIEQNRITEDDIRNGLEIARQYDCKSTTFVGLEIRLPRCQAFYEKIISETDQFAGIKVNFLAAEDVIADIARRKGRIAQWEAILSQFHSSAGYKRTLENERGGIAALKAGTYGQSLGGTGQT